MFAPHYALPLDHGCLAARAPLRASPSAEARAVSELLRGETFAVVDASGDWAWGFARADHYVGYVPLAALGPVKAATHIVSAPAALAFAQADIKAPLVERLPMGARIAALSDEGAFIATDNGFIHRRHLAPIEAREGDPVAVAERLIGAPYLWGGRSGDGIDCSGLVQLALARAGIAAPRDTDQQQAALGEPLPEGAPPERGDLVFWPGHVGMMADGERLLHANAHWMMVTIEPLADVIARLPAETRTPLIRRIAP